LNELSAEFDAQWRGYDVSEQRTMRAIVASAGSPYTATVLERLNATKDIVRKALPRLTATAEIETVNGKPAVVDPLFEAWIASLNRGESEIEAMSGDGAG
jgi:DNA-binding GntR family transcriptional regulator